MPTLLLITASSPEIRRVRRARVLNFQQVTMPYLTAFAPPAWEVVHGGEALDWPQNVLGCGPIARAGDRAR
jgi:hypothetical protein